MRLLRVPGGWVDKDVDLARMGWDNLLGFPEPIAAYAIDGRLLMFNEATQALLGWTAEEVDARGWIPCLYPDPADQAATYRNSETLARLGGPPRRHSRAVERADGTRIVLDLLSAPLVLDGGERGVFTILVDATRSAAPMATARGYKELVEDAPDILSRIDVRTGRYLFVSRAVERLTGYLPEELYADSELRLRQLLPEYREPLEKASRAVLHGEPQWLVLEYRRKDGGIVSLHQALYPIRDVSGHVVVVEGVARDITAVRALERELHATVEELKRRNEELSSLDRLKSQLLANVSHELRTPLVTIKGYNELILRGSLGPITPRQRRALEIACGSTERLVDLIETLLDFARREEGRLLVRRAPLDLRTVMREAVDQALPRIREKGLALELDLGEEPLGVDGDRARLGQVAKALIANAEKFTDGPGEIRVTARREGERIAFSVSDTGVGVPESARDKIFERFYQVDSSTTRRFGGAGLGLALAREIVTLHDGTIEVRSEEGRGSTFTVRLPALPSVEAAHGSERPVLLVGASSELGPALRERLEAEGLVALEATSGAEVMRRARRHRPDAVVLALEADLVETIEALHHDPETVSIPVIAMVEDARREDVLPLADYVVSPAEAPRLAEAVRRLLGRELPNTPSRPARILVVDDEPEIVDFTRFILEREGFEVQVAASGEAALLETNRPAGPPDLVVLDIALEGLDGIEICRRLKAQSQTAHVPVLMVTAMSGEEVRRSAFGAGADGFLTKPFGVEEFLRQVKLHLRSSAPEPVRAG